MTLPVLLVPSGASSAARARTAAALAAQTVEVTVLRAVGALADTAHDYVALVLDGCAPDVTACERAVWFLHTHPHVPCITGAALEPRATSPVLASLAQFVVTRREYCTALLAGDRPLSSASIIALVLGLRHHAKRGAGWVEEPLIIEQVAAPILAPIDAEARAGLAQLQLTEEALIERGASGLPALPLQRLADVPPPALTVRTAPTSGMRVLVLLQGFPMGGYTAFNADLLPRLAAAGHSITTCTTEMWRSDWRREQVRAAAPDIHHAHAVVPATLVPQYIDWLITTRRIDVVLLSHTFLGLHLLPWLRARHPGVAFVDYVHTDWFEAGMYGSYAELAVRWSGQLDAQLATSEALVSHLVARGCDAAGVRAAHIGIDTTAWAHTGPRRADIRQSLGAGPNTLVLLFSGRLAPEKRPHLAVDVAQRLVAEGQDAVLVFAGSGQLLQATHERAQRAALGERVKFLGEVDEATLKLIYAASDVLLAPSEIEGIARSLYEAMAMGCVPVVSDVGGQRELVVPGTGSLVPAERDEAAPYVAGVRPWLDRAALAQASAAARAHIVARFDVTRTVATVCDTLTLARERRQVRHEVLPEAMAEQFGVLGLEVMRRHLLRIVTATAPAAAAA